MNILANIFAYIGATCLWLAIALAATGSFRLHIEDMTPTQLQVFVLAGGASLCFIWAITIVGRKSQ